MQDTLKTIVLFGLLGALLVTLGRFVGGVSGMWLMLLISVVGNIAMYYFSDKIALKSAGAKPLGKKDYPFVNKMVKNICQKARIPEPKLFFGEDSQPNAFATGRNPQHSSVFLTKGLLENLSETEIEGVLAHEISHIKNRDILLATVASVVASLVTGISTLMRWSFFFGGSDENRNPLVEILTILIAPIAAFIIQMAISRSREFKADETGAKLAGNFEGLASALQRIDFLAKKTSPSEANPAFANLYICAPFRGRGSLQFFQKMFSTHPPVAERIERLREVKI